MQYQPEFVLPSLRVIMKKNTLVIMMAAMFAGAAGIFVQQLLHSAPPPVAVDAGLLNTPLPDLSGQPHTLAEWQGKILIINFWATWCPPCLKEIPEFIALQNEYADKNVQFIGIAVDEKQAVLDYNASAKINYPILIAGDAGIEMSKAWGNVISSIPFTVVLNSQGQIIYRQLGEINRQELLEIIHPL
jgi:thiol-disulfide isomerase/thioredoxin